MATGVGRLPLPRWATSLTPLLRPWKTDGYLGIKRDTVYKWISDKSMPAHKVGRLWKFKKVQVDKWVEAGGAASGTIDEKHN